jgi:hypothetical protein
MPYCIGLQTATAAFLSASLPTQILLVVLAISTIFFVASARPAKAQLVEDDILLPVFPLFPGV